jgi:hypothetical protein
MLILKQVKRKVTNDPTNWSIHLKDFVDDLLPPGSVDDRSVVRAVDGDRFNALLAATATGRFSGEDPPQLIEAEDCGAFSHKRINWSNARCSHAADSLTISATMLATEFH